MNADRELLELAAKAAGIEHPGGDHSKSNDGRLWDCAALRWWNPLTDDGDALRLAVKLRMNLMVKTLPHSVYVEAYNGIAPSSIEALADIRFDAGDPYVATRRAIVRAAAEIGRAAK